MTAPAPLSIRRARAEDADVIAEFNSAMCWETEHKRLIPAIIGAGVRRMLSDPSLGFYLVAEQDGQVVASLMVTTEWSDWRNGVFWWIQSVYVRAEYRRQGCFRALYQHLRDLAANEAGICGFRLYVEKDNRNAQATYLNLGMEQTDYLVFEELKKGVVYFTRD